MMNQSKKYAVFAGEAHAPDCCVQPADGIVEIVCMDSSVIPGCISAAAGWYCKNLTIGGLVRHKTDEVFILLGSDIAHPEKLNADVELQIENDVLHFNKTCAIFIPGGAAHGNMKVTNLEKPVLFCTCHPFDDQFESEPAMPTAKPGTYAHSFVDRYDTQGVELPDVAEGVLTRLFYLDNSRVPGAPYFESVWFNNTPAFLKAHTHELDEIIFFAGIDPENPGELGGKITFYVDGKPIELTRSCFLHIPAGVSHTPFDIVGLKHPILHFSGGNNSNYHRA